jgi:hypothetical protein
VPIRFRWLEATAMLCAFRSEQSLLLRKPYELKTPMSSPKWVKQVYLLVDQEESFGENLASLGAPWGHISPTQ